MAMQEVAWVIAVAAAALVGGVFAQVPTASQRMALAEHAIGINMAFYEAQRAGVRPQESPELFPGVWEWKKPAYENMCTEYLNSLPAKDRKAVDFPNFPGYFEAGNAVLVTAPTAFVTIQQAIGALQFMPLLAKMTPGDAFGDPAGCLRGGYTAINLKELLLRQIRYLGATLSNSLVVTSADNSKFSMLVGVADSTTYGGTPYVSWATPPSYQQKCYVADMDHPAADLAAMASAGLAMAAKTLTVHGTAADKTAVRLYGTESVHAYEYATLMYERHGTNASCYWSAANNNCVGSGCTTVEPDGDPVRSVCTLYRNEKDAPEFLFLAAAALYALTGNADYRADADTMFPTGPQSVEQQTFLYNWNNIVTQGIVILSMEPDVPAAANSRDFYRRFLRTSVSLWSQCSNEGEAIINDYKFCERTPGGSAYPLDFPWGNLGTTMNGMCAAGIYQTLGFDLVDSKARKDAACFMQRQLGYIFNHKCTTRDNSCNTNGPDGFSYMVGIGRYFPKRIHSRDVSAPHFRANIEDDPVTLCGALVSGPYENTAAMDGPVREGTDYYEDNRRRWQASEAAIDYTSSLVCTLMAYATMPESLFEGCPARTPFTGRGI
eukprot:jgi/Ulvmu1/10068/UM006_0015.1